MKSGSETTFLLALRTCRYNDDTRLVDVMEVHHARKKLGIFEQWEKSK